MNYYFIIFAFLNLIILISDLYIKFYLNFTYYHSINITNESVYDLIINFTVNDGNKYRYVFTRPIRLR